MRLRVAATSKDYVYQAKLGEAAIPLSHGQAAFCPSLVAHSVNLTHNRVTARLSGLHEKCDFEPAFQPLFFSNL